MVKRKVKNPIEICLFDKFQLDFRYSELNFVQMLINCFKRIAILAVAFCYSNNTFSQQFLRIEDIAIPPQVSDNVGVAIADYNSDGFLDIFITGNESIELVNPNWLLRNNGDGSFIDVTQQSGLASSVTGLGASWGDYDNDGDQDIFITGLSFNQLYQNEGDGTFVDITDNAGLGVDCISCLNLFTSSLWWDVDYDGDLDLYVSAHFDKSVQYINNGNGTFSKPEFGVKEGGNLSFCALPIDANNDGILDLYVANDVDLNNFLYLNDKSTFTEVAEEYGVEDPYDGMGLAICDFDNNGLFDFFVTNIAENSFYVNDGEGFQNRSEELNVDDTGWAWGVSFSDFDLDGFEDLFIVNQLDDNKSNVLFFNVQDGESRIFQNGNSNLENNIDSDSRSTVSFDYDNDGDLDILVTNNFARPHLFENTINESSSNNFVKIILQGTSSNRDGIGAEVTLTTSESTSYRIKQGVGLLSQSQTPIHFGLNQTTSITNLTIKWPSGVIEEYNDLPVNSTIHAIESNNYTILPANPAKKIQGCTDANSCTYDPSATDDDGSCQYIDPGSIDGLTSVLPLSEIEYSFNHTLSLTSYQWTIDNGIIISGQGTSTIKVRWDIAQNGQIGVVAFDDLCRTAEIQLPVTIEFSEDFTELNFEDYSIARMWNEVLLQAIRNDFARPTVHARNLFHISMAMYDSWALYNNSSTYLLGKNLHNYSNNFNGFNPDQNNQESLNITLSYAVYRVMSHRFQNSPGQTVTQNQLDEFMGMLNYDITNESTNYENGDAAALGNYIGSEVITYGLIDGANESEGYGNLYYQPINAPLDPRIGGNSTISNPNRWQPLILDLFIDQSGNILRDDVPDFLSPEWGNVNPFALSDEDLDLFERNGESYNVYHNPGSPPFLDSSNPISSQWYQWGFSLVSVWGAHLSPDDGVMWDISPKSIGNISFDQLPTNFNEFDTFYNLIEGGDIGNGRDVNPITSQNYEAQMVPRGDYARVLAEFWADGPDSETPPGHWFTLLNYVSDQPSLVRKLNGEGVEMDEFEWDIKSYFIMGGAMHDAAISAWGIKGWFDYIRPISAIRYLADLGQSTDSSLPNYDPLGMPLIEGYIELVTASDPLAGPSGENVNKIKLYTWRGHDFITVPDTDEAGVGWILAEDWWPYQRPSFITPPFAGYVSGHSTYSRAAAEVMTLLTGSEYFPGGMGTFLAQKDEFLVFEDGPSQDIELQWATYQDASDQCSLSRIWGGIHPPADDIPGRIIGEKIGKNAFNEAKNLFDQSILDTSKPITYNKVRVYPNPLSEGELLSVTGIREAQSFTIISVNGVKLPITQSSYDQASYTYTLSISQLPSGMYILKGKDKTWKIVKQ